MSIHTITSINNSVVPYKIHKYANTYNIIACVGDSLCVYMYSCSVSLNPTLLQLLNIYRFGQFVVTLLPPVGSNEYDINSLPGFVLLSFYL